jgi:hypothetical protein
MGAQVPEIIVGSAAVTIVPDVRNFARELAAKIVPAADAVGREAGKRVTKGMEDSVNDGLKRSAAKALASSGAEGAAIGLRMAEAIRKPIEAMKPEVKVKISANKTEFASFMAQVKSMVPDVNVGISISQAKLARFKAAIKAAVTNKDINVGIGVSQASIAKVSSAIGAIPARLKVDISLSQASVVKFKAEVAAVMASVSAKVTASMGAAMAAAGASGGGGGGGGGGWGAIGGAAGGRWFGGFFGVLRRQMPLFGGLFGGAPIIGHISRLNFIIHILIDLLLVVIPALATAAAGLGAFGAAAWDSGKQVAFQLQNMHIVGDALNTTIKPLTGNLEKLHDVVRPQVFQLFGAGLAAAGKNTAIFNQLATKTGGVLNTLAARIDIMVSHAGPGLTQFLKVGGQDMKQFSSIGQSIGSVFMDILKAGEQTQVAEKMLQALAIAFKAFATVIHVIPQQVLVIGIAFFSIVHYGGALVTLLKNLVTGFINFSVQVVNAAKAIRGFSLLGFISGNVIVLLLAVAAAIAYIAYEANQAGAKTRQFISDINSNLANMGGGSAFLALPQAIGKVTQQINLMKGTKAPSWIAQVNKGFSDQSLSLNGVKNRWHGFLNLIGIGMDKTASNIKALTSEQRLLISQYDNLGGAVFHAMTKGFSFTQSLGLMDAAGVKVNDRLDVMKQKIDNIVSGYAAMGQKSGAIGADMNALTVVASDQLSAMGKLNDAWDKFQALLAAPPTSFLAWDSAITTFGQDAAIAGASMQGLGGGAPVKFKAPKVSSASVALQNQFQSVIGASQPVLDALRNSNALGGTNDFTRSVKDMVAALLPLTGGSKAAIAQVSSLAQEAGGPATLGLKELTKWSGNQGAAAATADLYKQQQLAVTSTYNLNLDAQNLTKTLQQDLVPSMANAILKSSGAKQGIQDFANAAIKSHGDISRLYGPGKSLFDSLLKSGISPSSAKSMITGMLQELRFTPKQITQFWSGIAKGPKKPTPIHATPLLKPGPNRWVNDAMRGKSKPIPVPFRAGFGNTDQTVMHFFMVLIPSWTGRAQKNIANWARNSWHAFDGEFIHPIQRFFLQQFVHFIGVSGNWIANWAVTGWRHFYSGFVTPLSHFFMGSLPHFFSTAGHWISDWASKGRNAFYNNFIHPITHFFTVTLPGFFTSIPNQLGNIFSHINIGSLVPGPLRTVLHTLHIPGFAGGTSGAPRGWARVGERGPELVYFNGGETVLPNRVSTAITRGFANGTDTYMQGMYLRAAGIGSSGTSFYSGVGSLGSAAEERERELLLLARIAAASEAGPARTGTAVAKSLQNVSGPAAARKLYSTGSGY